MVCESFACEWTGGLTLPLPLPSSSTSPSPTRSSFISVRVRLSASPLITRTWPSHSQQWDSQTGHLAVATHALDHRGEGGVIVQVVLTDRWCLAHGYSHP